MNKSFAMDPFDGFDRRLADIHGIQQTSQRGITMPQGNNIDRSELRAMVAAFLGEDYDPKKVAEVERAQSEVRAQHASLAERYHQGQIGPIEYVDRFNAASFDSFAELEAILGKADFLKLFGPSPQRSVGFIDKEAFLRAHHERLNAEIG